MQKSFSSLEHESKRKRTRVDRFGDELERAGIDLSRDSAPDLTTILNFRHLLERHNLTKAIFDKTSERLSSKGLCPY